MKKYDQETVISMAGDEDTWHIYSCDPRIMGRIRRLAKRLALDLKSGTDCGPWVEILVPDSKVRMIGPRPAGKKLEGHRREVALSQLKAAREASGSRRVGEAMVAS